MVESPISPGTFLKSSRGQIYYSYSGIKTVGATSQTIIDIPNTGLYDLLIDMTATADWSQVAQYLGIAVDINGESIFYMVNDTSGGIDVQPPWHFHFFCPALSALKVISYTDGASLGASRSAQLVGTPLGTN